jgi:outer membrane protein TolC
MRTSPWLLLLPLLGAPASLGAQQPLLTEAAALARADRGGFANRIAAGQAAERAGQALAPLRGVLPGIRLEAGYLRTTDPLNAFGFLLKQRTVTAAAFNPARLNDPDAIGNLSTGLVLEQPILNADAWLGRRAATSAREAGEAGVRWSRATTAVLVRRAYWGAVLATEQVRTLEVAVRAGREHVRAAERLKEQGLATRSDLLLAEVKAGELEARLVAAKGEAGIAKRALAVVMGDPADTLWSLPDSLPEAGAVRAEAELALAGSADPVSRADVLAAVKGAEVARADRLRARSLYLPRVNGFGRVDWNDPDQPFAGKNSWTVGVMLTWSPFAGASEIAEQRASAGRLVAAEAMADAARGQATLELLEATEQLVVAREQLAIRERSLEQAREASRLVARKYDAGLATVTDLFDATATETATRLAHAAARYDLLVAAAERRKAMGEGGE